MKNIKIWARLCLYVVIFVLVFAIAQEQTQGQSSPLTTSGEVQESAQPTQQPEQKPMEQQAIPQQDERENGNNEDGKNYVDQREIKDVLRQISQQKSEIKRLVKAAQKQKLADATAELQSILSQITQHEQAIRSEGNGLTRDTLQEFYDAQIWEDIERLRFRVQLPQELKQIEKELKRVDALMKQKAIAAIPNLNFEAVRTKVAEIRAALEQAKSALAGGDTDALREAMETFWQEGGHPGEIVGTLMQLRDITSGLRRIKSADVREAILDILSPVFESVNDGDFREARMQLESVRQELMPLMQKAERIKSVDKNLQQKIQQLEQKLENTPMNQKTKGGQSYVPYWYNQRASIIGAISSWFGF